MSFIVPEKNCSKRLKVDDPEVITIEDGILSEINIVEKKSLFVREESELIEEFTNDHIGVNSDSSEIISANSSQTTSQPITTDSGITLSDEQHNIIKLAKNGHNIFYTGSAGTGKSVLLRELIKILKLQHGADLVAVTASTGLAACNIGGITVHSFAGVGLGKEDAERLFNKVNRSIRHRERWKGVQVLIIDEVSMIDSSLLDKLDYVAKKLRKSNLPFGGIQLIFSGDFFQLPPVRKVNDPNVQKAFDSKLWKEAFYVNIKLGQVFRQKGDLEFIDMLEKARMGNIDYDTEQKFRLLDRALPQDNIAPAQLFSTRKEVEIANISQLRNLEGSIYPFTSIDGGTIKDPKIRQNLLDNFMAPKILPLKIGAQVMMIKNVDETLVNGSLGKIIAFIDEEIYFYFIRVMLSDENLLISDLQKYKENMELLKLKVLSDPTEGTEQPIRQKISKDQFCKPDHSSPEINSEELFQSLLTVSKQLFPGKNISPENLELIKSIFMKLVESTKNNKKLPLVLFKTSDLKDRLVLVKPEDWSIDDEKDKVLVSRVQLPLILAWALSIHKSQGQTIPKLKVDLKKVFEVGQAYVAISRAVSREGLQISNFEKSKIMVDKKVIEFYSTLISAESALEKVGNSVKSRSHTKQMINHNFTNKSVSSFFSQSKRKHMTSKNNTGIIAMLTKRNKEHSK